MSMIEGFSTLVVLRVWREQARRTPAARVIVAFDPGSTDQPRQYTHPEDVNGCSYHGNEQG